jgi:hypothetical protein
MAIDWEKIDSIEKETDYEQYEYKERRTIQPSVQEQLSKFDKLACEGIPTEEDFHQDTQKVTYKEKYGYFQKALNQTLRWQSFCQTTT